MNVLHGFAHPLLPSPRTACLCVSLWVPKNNFHLDIGAQVEKCIVLFLHQVSGPADAPAMDQQTHLSVYKASRAIKQESDIVLHNRLQSIQKDRQFVDLVKRYALLCEGLTRTCALAHHATTREGHVHSTQLTYTRMHTHTSTQMLSSTLQTVCKPSMRCVVSSKF